MRGGGLKISGIKWECMGCSASGKIDRFGILRLSEDDYYYREVPRSFFAPVLVQNGEGIFAFDESLKQLDEKRRQIIILYYQQHLTMKQIAETLDITESRISQLHASAIFNLSAKLRNWKDGW